MKPSVRPMRRFSRLSTGIASPRNLTIAWIDVAIGLLRCRTATTAVPLFFCGVSLLLSDAADRSARGEKWVLVEWQCSTNPLVPVELRRQDLWTIVNVGDGAYFKFPQQAGPERAAW